MTAGQLTNHNIQSPGNGSEVVAALAGSTRPSPLVPRGESSAPPTASAKRSRSITSRSAKGEAADPIVVPDDIFCVPSGFIRSATDNLFATAKAALSRRSNSSSSSVMEDWVLRGDNTPICG